MIRSLLLVLLLPWMMLVGKVSSFVAPPSIVTYDFSPRVSPIHKSIDDNGNHHGVACNMMVSPKVALTAATLTLTGLASSLNVVQQGNVAIVERLGKFRKCLEPGLHVTIPIVDRIAKRLTKREQVFDIPPQDCITLDNAPLAADAVVYWKIFDPAKAFYSVVDLELAIQNLVLTQLRNEIGKLTLDATFSAREQINSVLLKDLDIATDPWGVKITRVEVRDIIPNPHIKQAMEKQMAAERTKRAVIIQSEGEKSRAINEAEGEARSRVIDAQATADSIQIRAQAEASQMQVLAEGAAKSLQELTQQFDGSTEKAAQYQLARQSLLAQQALATSNNAKVILSSSSQNNGVLSSSSSSSDDLIRAFSVYDGTTNPMRSPGTPPPPKEE